MRIDPGAGRVIDWGQSIHSRDRPCQSRKPTGGHRLEYAGNFLFTNSAILPSSWVVFFDSGRGPAVSSIIHLIDEKSSIDNERHLSNEHKHEKNKLISTVTCPYINKRVSEGGGAPSGRPIRNEPVIVRHWPEAAKQTWRP